ncbi:MAG: dihydrolipoamide acetyltransferase family protein [Nocardioides sp.]
MARVLRMPGVAANATEAVLSEWLVAESADFADAQAIATVETEKAAVEIEAEGAGRMLRALVPAGAQVEVGDPIAVLGEPGEQVADLPALLASLDVSVVEDATIPERRTVPPAPEPAAPLAVEVEMPAPPGPRPAGAVQGRVFASPLARRIARQNDLAVADIEGTGPRGRILRRDVENALTARAASAATAGTEPGPATGRGFDDIPHSRIREVTARRLTESKQQAPHFYLRATARAEALLALRSEVNEGATTRVSVNDLLVKAVAAAHKRVPEMNVTWGPESVRRYRTVDIAVAVATERGLMTPVVRDVGALSATAVSESVRELAVRAREGRLRPDELEGGSISVTNLGMYGVDEFAAIINPPHAAILAIGAVRDVPVVEQGAVVAGQVLTMTLSVDHRPVDGVVAARWMAALVELVEHPARILA